MRRFLKMLMDLGTAGRPDSEVRTLRAHNTGALIGMGVSVLWTAGQLANGWAEAWINVGAVLLYAGVLLLNARRHPRVAQHLIVIAGNLQVLLLSVFGFSGVSGGHLWLLALAVVPFLMLFEHERVARLFYTALSTVLAVCIELKVLPSINPHTLTEMQIHVSRALNFTLVTLTLVFLVTRFVRDIRRAEAENDRLLQNILPPVIAHRLRHSSALIADHHAQVTVVFADIVGFTAMAERVSAGELVAMLNEIFSLFDDVADELGLEKIKTIGDAYMVAAGVPVARDDHAQASVEMAVRMRDIVQEVQRRSGDGLQIRIGIHSGPVVAGVIGKRKFVYDLWGDVVNTAARMESHGLAGEIQVSRVSWEHLAPTWEMEPRGKIPIKGKGELETYLLRGRRTGGRA